MNQTRVLALLLGIGQEIEQYLLLLCGWIFCIMMHYDKKATHEAKSSYEFI